MIPTKYFLYARKSTDEDDRQILSIESQLTELREFAQKERLTIAQEFTESMSAKVPGRPVFNRMIELAERQGAVGLLAWHPDRLARNSVDGGRIVYLLDTGTLSSLKFPTFWFENTPQGKFMLTIAFGQSKYYVDNLIENIWRGLRQKLRRGEFPGKPPLGYLNEPRLRTIVVDPATAPLARQMFEAYASGHYTLQQIRTLVAVGVS
jgi:DNA invertase Pin-like site-specific DNA recombinase